MKRPAGIPSPLDFYSRLRWLDGRPLLDTMEPYRRKFLTTALYTFRPDGVPLYNMVLSGRAKKNWKSSDLVLASFYRFLCWESPAGNDCLIAANTEDQANDDLGLAKKLVQANHETLGREVSPYQKELRRKDERGVMRILPSRDAVGAHGKTALFLGFDEVHGYRDWDLFEALAPDPTRADTLTWITTYDTIYNSPGVPLYDLKRTALAGEDPRLCFQWYSADLCTDPEFAEKPPEERANPSMGSWPEGAAYLEQQRRRLPSHKFRRLHLNLPGTPSGAFFDGDAVMACIMTGLRRIPPEQARRYFGYVDMSGGSADEAVLAIGHFDCGRRVLDTLIAQDGSPPFNPRLAVRKFARVLKDYGLDTVTGDRYAGETHRFSFTEEGVRYHPISLSATDIYEATEPLVNAGEVEFLDHPKMQEQLLTLVVRGARVTHQPGDHDDYANAACGCLALMPKSIRSADQHRQPRVLLGYSGAKGVPLQADWRGWFAEPPVDTRDRDLRPAPRVHLSGGRSFALHTAPRRNPATDAELDTRKIEKIPVGTDGFYLERYGAVAGDGRQRYQIYGPGGAALKLVWGRAEATTAALGFAKKAVS